MITQNLEDREMALSIWSHYTRLLGRLRGNPFVFIILGKDEVEMYINKHYIGDARRVKRRKNDLRSPKNYVRFSQPAGSTKRYWTQTLLSKAMWSNLLINCSSKEAMGAIDQ